MKTTIIILAIIIILLMIYCFLQKRHSNSCYKELARASTSYQIAAHELITSVKKQRNEAYASIGNILHYLHYMFEKGPNKYIPLVTALGEYIRQMYIKDYPFFELSEDKLNPELTHFPCLDEEENKQMLSFLQEIKDEKRNPVDLLDFLNLLTDPERDFKNAINQTIAMSTPKIIQNNNQEQITRSCLQ